MMDTFTQNATFWAWWFSMDQVDRDQIVESVC
jgi:hypothetical protein